MSWNEIQFMLNQGILQYSWASKRFVYIFSPFIRSKWIRGAFYLTTDKGLFITRRQYLSFRKGWLLICYLLSVGTYLWCMMFLNRLEAFLCRNNFFPLQSKIFMLWYYLSSVLKKSLPSLRKKLLTDYHP